MMIDTIRWLGHSAFYIEGPGGRAVYFDPYGLKEGLPKADLIFISHGHYDHCSATDIAKIYKPQTVIIAAPSAAGTLSYPVKIFKPGEKMKVMDIGVEAVPAYNTTKEFHPRHTGNLGFIVTIDSVRLYHAGDTDLIPEMKDVKADIALLPIGGTYTMNAAEAAEAANIIGPAVAIPMHFGNGLGSAKDAEEFKRLSKAEVRILKKG